MSPYTGDEVQKQGQAPSFEGARPREGSQAKLSFQAVGYAVADLISKPFQRLSSVHAHSLVVCAAAVEARTSTIALARAPTHKDVFAAECRTAAAGIVRT